MTMTDASPRRDLPAWVFVLVILLCIGGGVGFVYWYFLGAGPTTSSITLKSPEEIAAAARQEEPRQRQRRQEPRRQAPAPRSLLQITANQPDQRSYTLRGRTLTLNVVDHRTNADRFTFRAPNRRLLNDEQLALANLRWRVLRDTSTARFLNVQEWQLEKLRPVETTGAVISDGDRAKVMEAWARLDVWNQTPSPEAERQLLALLDEVGGRSEAATRARLAEQVSQIKSVLTPEQIAAFGKMGEPGAVSPPVPPAPAP